MARNYLKNIKSENRIDKLRYIEGNKPVVGGHPSDNMDEFTSSDGVYDLACTVKYSLGEIEKIDKKIPVIPTIPKVIDSFGDSTTDAGSQRTINEVNKSAKNAQTAANTANDKANEAKQLSYQNQQELLKKRNQSDYDFPKIDINGSHHQGIRFDKTENEFTATFRFYDSKWHFYTGERDGSTKDHIYMPQKGGIVALTSDISSLNIDYALVDFGTVSVDGKFFKRQNPFGSVPVITLVEIKLGEKWTPYNWFEGSTAGDTYGVVGGFIDNNLVIRVGSRAIVPTLKASSALDEGVDETRHASSAPARMHVWRLKK